MRYFIILLQILLIEPVIISICLKSFNLNIPTLISNILIWSSFPLYPLEIEFKDERVVDFYLLVYYYQILIS